MTTKELPDYKAFWFSRFCKAAAAFDKIKNMTKKVPASQWTPEYRELAEAY